MKVGQMRECRFCNEGSEPVFQTQLKQWVHVLNEFDGAKSIIACTRKEDEMMDVKQVVKQSVSRANRWHPKGMEDWSALEWAGAMCGEAGEAANAAKKLKRLETNMNSINEGARHITTLEEARKEVAKEAADTILYAVLLMSRVGIDNVGVEDVLRQVFNKKI